MRQWRLITDYPTGGVRNMAVDEAVARAVAAGDAPPTLRLYAWNPPCLSLGIAQPAADVDFDRAAALGWDVVRRPTGGRAILHTDELTYSVALRSDDDLAAGDVLASYHRISGALVAGLARLGVMTAADRRAEHRPNSGGPVCFETPSHYEITVGGRKLVGSAQVRRGGSVLQHGTLPLLGDVARITDVLVYPDEAARAAARDQVRRRAAALAEFIGMASFEILWGRAAEAVIQGFAETFAIAFTTGSLSAAEAEMAEHLMNEIYGSQAYTHRR